MKTDYKNLLRRKKLLKKAEKWLVKNPPPDGWVAGKWAWAYLEMPI